MPRTPTRLSHLKIGAASSSWRVKLKQLEIVPLVHILAQVRWRIQFTTKEIKSQQGYDTLTTTTLTNVKSTLDKLKETRVIHDEARRYNHA